MKATIKERIYTVMSAVFEISLESINDNSSSDNIESWDSLKHLTLILALEEEFGIIIPDSEVGILLNYRLIELVTRDLIND